MYTHAHILTSLQLNPLLMLPSRQLQHLRQLILNGPLLLTPPSPLPSPPPHMLSPIRAHQLSEDTVLTPLFIRVRSAVTVRAVLESKSDSAPAGRGGLPVRM